MFFIISFLQNYLKMNHEAQHDNPELAPNAKWVHETSAEVNQKPSYC